MEGYKYRYNLYKFQAQKLRKHIANLNLSFRDDVPQESKLNRVESSNEDMFTVFPDSDGFNWLTLYTNKTPEQVKQHYDIDVR